MLSVTIKSNMLSVVMLSVVMLSVVMLSVVMLSVVMLSVVMLSVVMPNVIAPSAGNVGVVKLNVVDDDDASTNPQNFVADVASQ